MWLAERFFSPQSRVARGATFQRREICFGRRRQHFESERARRGDRLEKANFGDVAEAVARARARTYERMRGLDVVIVVASKA
jgi:hypothetical protein